MLNSKQKTQKRISHTNKKPEKSKREVIEKSDDIGNKKVVDGLNRSQSEQLMKKTEISYLKKVIRVIERARYCQTYSCVLP